MAQVGEGSAQVEEGKSRQKYYYGAALLLGLAIGVAATWVIIWSGVMSGWYIETTRIALQAGTLIAVIVGLGFTTRQLRLTTQQLEMLSVNNSDLHDWNRRKAAQDAIDDMVTRLAHDTRLLDKKFNVLTNRGEATTVERIESICKEDNSVRLALHKRLNYFESLAAGVQQGVFDEEVIKNTYQHLIGNTLAQFREYIERYSIDQSAKEIWNDLQGMHERWAEADRVKAARTQTGHETTKIRPRKSKGG